MTSRFPSLSSQMCRHSLHATVAAAMLACAAGAAIAQTATGARSSAFEYDAVTGLLKAEIVEPDSADHCVRTSYTLDNYGNRTGATTSACPGAGAQAQFASRTTASPYAAQTVAIPNVGGAAVPAGAYPSSVTNALGQGEARQYDPRFGALMTQTGPNGLTTQWQYDDFGRKVLEIAPDGNRIVTRYCLLPARASDTSANSDGCTTPANTPADALSYVETHMRDAAGTQTGPGTRKYMDILGREIRQETEGYDGPSQPGNLRMVLKDTHYNDTGAVVKVTQPYFASNGTSIAASGAAAYGWTVTHYDAQGRPVSVLVRDSEGSGTYEGLAVAEASFTYNGLTVTETRLRTSKNAQDQQQAGTNLVTHRVSNPLGQLEQVIDGLNYSLRKRYDPFGNVVEVRDAMDNSVVTSFDVRGRKTQLADPNAGTWQYRYNALGELVGQLSPTPGSTWTTMVYDVLGRMTQRSEPEYVTTWTYDKYADNSSCNKGIGKLCETATSHGVKRKTTYDNLGRPIGTTQTVQGGPSFTSAQNYTAAGQVATYTYPTGAQITNVYTPLGYLSEVRRQGQVVWQLRTANAWGKAERYDLGSAAQATKHAYDALTGRTLGINVGNGDAGGEIQRQTYGWDTVGNLTDRADSPQSQPVVSENFGYDPLNRLTSYQTSSAGIAGLSKDVTLAYNAIGNITSKSDVGTYSYPASGAASVRPGAVSSITGAAGQSARSYTYDAAGNLTASTGGKYTTLQYTSFNLPASLSGAGGSYSWQYGPGHERIKEVKGGRTTWYFHPDNAGGLAYEQEQGPSGTVNRHYISVMGRTVQMFEGNSGGSITKTQWWHADHLGSVVTQTSFDDEAGVYQVTQRFSYDPFGKRRQVNGTYDAMGTLVYDHPNATDRGFTGHEHLDDVGVIHMNGRTYDPHIGRFMQADPIIQEPDNGQNYNRFSYVLNNPLNATDPSGHSFKKIVRIAVAIAIAVYAPGLFAAAGEAAAAVVAGSSSVSCLAAAGTVFTNYAAVGMFAGGFAAGVVATGSLEGGITGAVTAGMFHGAAGFGTAASAERYAAHAVAGCAHGMMGGNGCGRGAASAVAGKWGTNASGDNAVAAVVAGGTASVIGGGKFENGATTAVFGYLFNHVLSRGAQLVQQAWGSLQMFVASPTGQLLTEMAAAEVGMASIGAGKAAGVLEQALGRATIDPKHSGQLVTVLEDGTRMMFRKEYGHVEGFGPTVHYNIHLQAGSKQVSNIHVVTGAEGRVIYAKDSMGRWNGGQTYRLAPEQQIPK